MPFNKIFKMGNKKNTLLYEYDETKNKNKNKTNAQMYILTVLYVIDTHMFTSMNVLVYVYGHYNALIKYLFLSVFFFPFYLILFLLMSRILCRYIIYIYIDIL